MARSSGKSGGVKGIGLVTIIFGIIFVVAGAVTWGAVTTNLGAEKINVSDDADYFAGQLVDTPWEAWVQADVINTHALEASGGLTYAELPQDDPKRDTVMTASFLRASLFTSVVAFGVALLVVGIGVVLLLIGFALRKTGSRLADVDGQTAALGNPYTAPDPAVAPAAAAQRPAAQPAAAPVAAAPPAAAPVAAAPPAAAPVAEKTGSDEPAVDDTASTNPPSHTSHAASPEEPPAPRTI